MIYDWIVKQVLNGKKLFALLLDPDEYNDQSLRHTLIEAGSGAQHPVKTEMITRVKKNIKVPLVVGGGIRNPEDAKNILNAGADIIVIGNAIEKDTSFLKKISYITKNWSL